MLIEPEISAIVTTCRRPSPGVAAEARSLATRVGGAYVERDDLSLAMLEQKADGLPVVVVESERVVAHASGQTFFFHPGLVRMRLAGRLDGRPEPFLEALAVGPGDRVLDATMGRASDAILAACVVGDTGVVAGLEVSPVVAEITRLGLATYTDATPEIVAGMRRVRVECADYGSYLQTCQAGAFDVIYFDPMFDTALPGCPSIDPLRPLASHEPLDASSLARAAQVARRRVVVKDRRGASMLRRLGIEARYGGRYSRVAYGILAGSG